MAKRGKSKSIQLSLCFIVLECLLAVVALVMVFVPALGVNNSNTTYSGLNVIFGCKVANGNADLFYFSFMNLLTYILVLAAIVLIILKFVFKKRMLFNLLIALILVVAGIFFFLTKQFTLLNESAVNVTNFASAVSQLLGGGSFKAMDAFYLAAGPIVSGILVIIGGLLACCEIVLVKD